VSSAPTSSTAGDVLAAPAAPPRVPRAGSAARSPPSCAACGSRNLERDRLTKPQVGSPGPRDPCRHGRSHGRGGYFPATIVPSSTMASSSPRRAHDREAAGRNHGHPACSQKSGHDSIEDRRRRKAGGFPRCVDRARPSHRLPCGVTQATRVCHDVAAGYSRPAIRVAILRSGWCGVTELNPLPLVLGRSGPLIGAPRITARPSCHVPGGDPGNRMYELSAPAPLIPGHAGRKAARVSTPRPPLGGDRRPAVLAGNADPPPGVPGGELSASV